LVARALVNKDKKTQKAVINQKSPLFYIFSIHMALETSTAREKD